MGGGVGWPERPPRPAAAAAVAAQADVVELAGVGTAPQFALRPDAPPPEELRTFLRLLNLGGTDAFLLEPLFRDNAWALIRRARGAGGRATCSKEGGRSNKEREDSGGAPNRWGHVCLLECAAEPPSAPLPFHAAIR